MVSLLAMVPLLLTLTLGLGALLYALKKKSMAQSLCVRAGLQMQTALGRTLTELIQMNGRAEMLRQKRAVADRNLQAALASGVPPAIASAQAVQTAVILEQLQLRSEQEQKFLTATHTRLRYARELRSDLSRLRIPHVESRSYYFRSLAVRPTPPTSLSPDYVPAPRFEQTQQHRFRFSVNLAPDLSFDLTPSRFRQTTECSITLKQDGYRWKPRILAANAPLSY